MWFDATCYSICTFVALHFPGYEEKKMSNMDNSDPTPWKKDLFFTSKSWEFLKNSSTGTLFSFFFYMMGSLSTGNTINLMNVLFSWNTFRVIFSVVLAGMYEMSFGKMMMECFFLALIIIYL